MNIADDLILCRTEGACSLRNHLHLGKFSGWTNTLLRGHASPAVRVSFPQRMDSADELILIRTEGACVKTMMVYMLFRVIVYTFIKQAGYLGS